MYDPPLHRQDVLPETLVRKPVLAGIVAQAQVIVLSHAGGMNEHVHREIAVFRSCEFVNQIPDHLRGLSPVSLAIASKRLAQFIEQPHPGAIPEKVGHAVRPAKTRGRRPNAGPRGLFAFDQIHSVKSEP